jgi:hypothetical protein
LNDNLLSPNDIDFATRCTEGAGHADFISPKAILVADIFCPDVPAQPGADAFIRRPYADC